MSPNRRTILWFLSLSTAGSLLVLWATSRFGAGVTPDSAAYISAARSLIAGTGFNMYTGLPYVSWPPLFPSAIALPGLMGVDAPDAARYINAAVFGAIIFVTSFWLHRTLRWPVLVWVGVPATVLSESLFKSSVHVWSDPVFVLLALLFLITIQRFLERGGMRGLLLAGLLAGLACLTRYVGITLILSGAILLVAQDRTSRRAAFINAAVFSAIAASPMLIWVWRNFTLTGMLTGPRSASTTSAFERTGDVIGTASEWFLPSIAGIALLIYAGTKTVDSGRAPRRPWRKLSPMAVFAVLYTMFVFIASLIVHFDELGHRLLSPVYIPVLFLILTAIDRRRSIAPSPVTRTSRRLVFFAAVLWLAFPLGGTIARVVKYERKGIGTYSTRLWHESALMEHLRTKPLPGEMYSNAPDAVYVLAGQEAVFSPGTISGRMIADAPDLLAAFRNSAHSDSAAHLVWFNRVRRTYLMSVAELREVCSLFPVGTFPDGVIYRLEPQP